MRKRSSLLVKHYHTILSKYCVLQPQASSNWWDLCEGSISDKDIMERSGVCNKQNQKPKIKISDRGVAMIWIT